MKRWKSEIDAWEFVNIYLRSDAITVTNTRFYLNDAFAKVYNLFDVWQGESSGWTLDAIQNIHININDYDPLAGSSYIQLPKKLQNSMRGLINSYPNRIKKVDTEIANQLDYSNFEFTLKEKQCPLFEKRFNINLNVFYYNNQIYPLYISTPHNEKELSLLLIYDEDKSHYVFIKDLNSLMHRKTKRKGRKHFCMHCLQSFTTEEVLNNHKEKCLTVNGTQKSTYEEGIIEFKNFDKQTPIPFKIYADIECYNKKVNIKKAKSTSFYLKHIPNSAAAKLVCIDDNFTHPIKIFFGSKCINEFLQWVFKIKMD